MREYGGDTKCRPLITYLAEVSCPLDLIIMLSFPSVVSIRTFESTKIKEVIGVYIECICDLVLSSLKGFHNDGCDLVLSSTSHPYECRSSNGLDCSWWHCAPFFAIWFRASNRCDKWVWLWYGICFNCWTGLFWVPLHWPIPWWTMIPILTILVSQWLKILLPIRCCIE